MKRLLYTEDTVTSALQQLDLTQHDANVLLDGCGGSLSDIARLHNVEDLLHYTSLDKATAINIIQLMDREPLQ